MKENKFHIPPKAVLFDWDNTLVDTLPIMHDAILKSFAAHDGPEWTLEDTKIKSHQAYTDYLPEIFPDKWESVVEAYRQHYVDICTDLQLFPKALEVLSLLNENQVYVALVSNKRGELLRKEVQKLGLEDYFSRIIGGGDLEHDKPHPITVDTALAKTGISPDIHHVWFIGDSSTDMKTAHNANCLPLFFGDDDHTCDRYADCRPGFHAENHDQLHSHIRKILGV